MPLSPEQKAALDSVRVVTPPKPPPKYPREKVEHGEIHWRPVDKTAAMVVAKAPWWARPPVTEQHKPQVKSKVMESITHKDVESLNHSIHRLLESLDYLRETKTQAQEYYLQVHANLKEASIEQAKEYLDQRVLLCSAKSEEAMKFADLYAKAGNVIAETVDKLQCELALSEKTLELYLTHFLLSRQAIVRESGQMVVAMKELSTYFHGSSFQEQWARMEKVKDWMVTMRELVKDGTFGRFEEFALKMMEANDRAEGSK